MDIWLFLWMKRDAAPKDLYKTSLHYGRKEREEECTLKIGIWLFNFRDRKTLLPQSSMTLPIYSKMIG